MDFNLHAYAATITDTCCAIFNEFTYKTTTHFTDDYKWFMFNKICMYSAKLSVSSLCVNVFSFVNKKMLIPLDKYFSSLGVLNDYALYKSSHSLAGSPRSCFWWLGLMIAQQFNLKWLVQKAIWDFWSWSCPEDCLSKPWYRWAL